MPCLIRYTIYIFISKYNISVSALLFIGITYIWLLRKIIVYCHLNTFIITFLTFFMLTIIIINIIAFFPHFDIFLSYFSTPHYGVVSRRNTNCPLQQWVYVCATFMTWKLKILRIIWNWNKLGLEITTRALNSKNNNFHSFLSYNAIQRNCTSLTQIKPLDPS